MTQLLYGCVDFRLFDLAILVILVSRAKALPGKLSLKEVQDHIASTFEVVSTGLFDAQVSVG